MTDTSDRLLWPLRNPDDGRLRAGWRIVAMLTVYLALTIATMGLVESFFTGRGQRLAAAVAILLVGLLAAWLPARYLDRRPFRTLGLRTDRHAAVDVAIGAVLGLVLTGGVLIVYLAAGWAEVVDWRVGDEGSFAATFSILVLTYAAVAVLEEVLFRGYLITNLTEGFDRLRRLTTPRWLARWAHGLPVAAAVAVSSVVFAHFHGEELTGMQYLHFTLAGLLLAIPYVMTGQLALSIGLHWTFNVGATGLFNIEGGVPAFVRLDLDGPAAWVGEAALTETLAIVVMLPVVLAVARGRQRSQGSVVSSRSSQEETMPDHGDRRTRPTTADVERFLDAVADERRRTDARQVVDTMRRITGTEPRMWGSSIIGFGHQPYTTADGKERDWFAVGLAPRKAALTLYGLTFHGSNDDLLERLGRHSTGKGCLYVKRLDDVDRDVLEELIARSWATNHAHDRQS